MRPLGKDAANIDVRYVHDVESYIRDNKINFGCVEELTPQQFFQFYLNWNGIIGYLDTFLSLVEQLGWELKQDEPRIMSDDDRALLISHIQEVTSNLNEDQKSWDLNQELLECQLNGTKGLKDSSDEELLAEVCGDFLNDQEEFTPDEFDAANDGHRIWAKYKKPEILCPTCHGVGTLYDLGDPHECPTCNGSGLQDNVLPPKFTVVRVRKLVEYCEVRAKDAKEAAEHAKKCSWTQQDAKQTSLEVFTPESVETSVYSET